MSETRLLGGGPGVKTVGCQFEFSALPLPCPGKYLMHNLWIAIFFFQTDKLIILNKY